MEPPGGFEHGTYGLDISISNRTYINGLCDVLRGAFRTKHILAQLSVIHSIRFLDVFHHYPLY